MDSTTTSSSPQLAELEHRLLQRESELALMSSIQEGIMSRSDLQSIYDNIGDSIRDLFDAQVVMICTFDHENGLEKFNYLFEDGERINITSRPIDRLRKRLIQTGELILLNENIDEQWTQITGEEPTSLPGTMMTLSALYVPMVLQGTVLGYLSLQSGKRENAFSDSDVRLLTSLTNSLSLALENARLFNGMEQRNAELAVINSVQQGLVAELDMQGIYDLVGDCIRQQFDSEVTAIVTFEGNNSEHFKYLFEEGKRHYPSPRPLDRLRTRIIQEQKTLVLNTRAADEIAKINGTKDSLPIPGTKAPQSAIYVPMLVGEQVQGYLSLQNLDGDHPFSESDIRLLNTLVNSMSVALENARLFNETSRLLGETEQRATELQTVNNISHALVSQLELKALIKLIGEQMRTTFNADIVYLALYDRKSNMLHFPYMHGEHTSSRPFGNGITEKIIINGEPLLINQELEKAYDRMEAERKGTWVESFLGVPIITNKETIGAISVQSTKEKNRFTENDLRLLKTIAANVGIAMQNAEAYQKLQEAMTELKAAQDQLIQQEKLASLGQLTAGIAHEIKNPLNFVNNFSDVNLELIDEALEEINKLKEEETKQEIEQLLRDVKLNLVKVPQHGTRADSIVKSMLQHSRGGTGKMEPTDLNALLREFVNLSFHGMRAGKKAINVKIDLNLDEKTGEVYLINEDFSRVILNLCNNAFDAMRERLLKEKDYNAVLTVRSRKENNKVIIEIADNGPGIPPGLQDKVLQPFFTTKKGTEGTGLGLSITHDIIKAHKGSLQLHSKPGQGTCFVIQLNPVPE